jgi:hypothetical protein
MTSVQEVVKTCGNYGCGFPGKRGRGVNSGKERFISNVRSTILRFNMLSPGDKVLVGVSGGPDSRK